MDGALPSPEVMAAWAQGACSDQELDEFVGRLQDKLGGMRPREQSFSQASVGV